MSTTHIFNLIKEQGVPEFCIPGGNTSMLRFLTNLTDKFIQQYYDEFISTTQSDFKSFSEILVSLKENGHVVVLSTNDHECRARNEVCGDRFNISQVM